MPYFYVNRYNGAIHKASGPQEAIDDEDELEEFMDQASWDPENSDDELLKYEIDFDRESVRQVEFGIREQALIDRKRGEDDDDDDEDDDEEDDEDEDEDEDEEDEERHRDQVEPNYDVIAYGQPYNRCPSCNHLIERPILRDIFTVGCPWCDHRGPLREFVQIKGRETCELTT